MNQERLRYLFQQYFNSNSTPQENQELTDLVRHLDEKQLSELLFEAWESQSSGEQVIPSSQASEIISRILSEDNRQQAPVVEIAPSRRRGIWKYLTAAAIIIVLLGAGYFALFLDKKQVPVVTAVQQKDDLLPGQSGAVLTLANGQKIILDSARNGVLATQGSSKVIHSNGEIRYQSDADEADPAMMNTVTTPKGRQFQLLLSDGSKVWLNAASSIQYPAKFDAFSRSVTVTGEVYFEVARDIRRPFKVIAAGKQEVEVLGTHFNINAYADEPSVNTTLLEGSVKISPAGNGKSIILKPGQQSQVGHELEIRSDVDVNEVMAWKNGYFSFNGASTEAIMRQITRWYDAEVVYRGNVRDERFAGSVPRSENASKLLEVLELTKTLKFTIEGRKIIVTPYQ